MQALPSNRPLLKVSVLVALLAVTLAVAIAFPDLLWALIISALLAFVLKPVVKYLELRVGMSRTIAVIGVFLFLGGSCAFAVTKLTPWLVARATVLYDQLRTFPFDRELNKTANDLAGFLPFLKPSDITRQAHAFINSTLQSMNTEMETIFSAVFTIAIIPVITFFILSGGDITLKKLIELVPNKYFEMTLNVLHKIQRDLVGYLRGWILDSVIVGILCIFGYIVIGVDYPMLIGTIAGIANLVPYVGPIAGAIPAFAISLTQYGDFRMFVPITILTIVIQTLDNIIIQPLCFAKTVDMHPLMVVILLIAGNELMGVGGMLLAIPVATILKVSAEETYWGLKHYRITA